MSNQYIHLITLELNSFIVFLKHTLEYVDMNIIKEP